MSSKRLTPLFLCLLVFALPSFGQEDIKELPSGYYMVTAMAIPQELKPGWLKMTLSSLKWRAHMSKQAAGQKNYPMTGH